MKNKREEILNAAEEEFARNGYQGASISRIAKRVGVTHVLLYYHFKNKENLFASVLQRKIMEFCESMMVATHNGGLPFSDIVDIIVANNFDYIVQNALLVRMAIHELPEGFSLYQLVGDSYAAHLSDFQAVIDAAAAEGQIMPISVRRLMLSICSLNAMAVVVYPAFETIFPTLESNREAYLAERKAENIAYIHTLLHTNNNQV